MDIKAVKEVRELLEEVTQLSEAGYMETVTKCLYGAVKSLKEIEDKSYVLQMHPTRTGQFVHLHETLIRQEVG